MSPPPAVMRATPPVLEARSELPAFPARAVNSVLPRSAVGQAQPPATKSRSASRSRSPFRPSSAPNNNDPLPHPLPLLPSPSSLPPGAAPPNPLPRPPLHPRLSSSDVSSGPGSSSEHTNTHSLNSQDYYSAGFTSASTPVTTPSLSPNPTPPLPKGAGLPQGVDIAGRVRAGFRPLGRKGKEQLESSRERERERDFDPTSLLPSISTSSTSTAHPLPSPTGIPTSTSLPSFPPPTQRRTKLKKRSTPTPPPSAWSLSALSASPSTFRPSLPSASANSSTSALSVVSTLTASLGPPTVRPQLNRSTSAGGFGSGVVRIVRSLSWRSMKRSASGRSLAGMDPEREEVPPLPSLNGSGFISSTTTSTTTTTTTTTTTSDIPTSRASIDSNRSTASRSSTGHGTWGWGSRMSSQRAKPPRPRGDPPGIEEAYGRLVGDPVVVPPPTLRTGAAPRPMTPAQAQAVAEALFSQPPPEGVAGPSNGAGTVVSGGARAEPSHEEINTDTEDDDALYMRPRNSQSPPPAYTPRHPPAPAHTHASTSISAPQQAEPPTPTRTQALARRLSRPNLQGLPFTTGAQMPEVTAPGALAALTGQRVRARRSVVELVMREPAGTGLGREGSTGSPRRRALSNANANVNVNVSAACGGDAETRTVKSLGSSGRRRKTLDSVDVLAHQSGARVGGVGGAEEMGEQGGNGKGHARSKSASLGSRAAGARTAAGEGEQAKEEEWSVLRKRTRSFVDTLSRSRRREAEEERGESSNANPGGSTSNPNPLSKSSMWRPLPPLPIGVNAPVAGPSNMAQQLVNGTGAPAVTARPPGAGAGPGPGSRYTLLVQDGADLPYPIHTQGTLSPERSEETLRRSAQGRVREEKSEETLRLSLRLAQSQGQRERDRSRSVGRGHGRKVSAPLLGQGEEGLRVDTDLARLREGREGSVRTARTARSAGSGGKGKGRAHEELGAGRPRANTVGGEMLPLFVTQRELVGAVVAEPEEMRAGERERKVSAESSGGRTVRAPLVEPVPVVPLVVNGLVPELANAPLPPLPISAEPRALPPAASPRKSRFTFPGLAPFPSQAPSVPPVQEVLTPPVGPLKRATLSSKNLPDALRRAFSFKSSTPPMASISVVAGDEPGQREQLPPVPPVPQGTAKLIKLDKREKEGLGALPAKALRRRSSSIHLKRKSVDTLVAAASSATASESATPGSSSSPTDIQPRLRRASTMAPSSSSSGIARVSSPPPPVPELPPALTSPIKSAKKLFRRPRTSSNPKSPVSASSTTSSSILSPLSSVSAPIGHIRPPMPVPSHTVPPPVPSLPLPRHMVPQSIKTRDTQVASPVINGRVDLRALAFTGFAARPSTDHGHSYEFSSPSSTSSSSPPPSPSTAEHGDDTPRKRPRMLRGTSDLRRWTLAEFPDDVSFLRALGQRAKSDIGHGSDEAMADGDGTIEGDDEDPDHWWTYKEPGEGDAGRALLCVREIVRTEESYRRRLETMYASTKPLPQTFLSHLPALILASSHLSRRLADDPSAWGVATALVGCEDELERAFVSWSAVVGDVVWGVSRSSKKNKKGSWSEEVREVAVMPTQRVPRYVLMYRELLHFTPPSSPSRPLVERALEGALRIAARCDAAQRHKDGVMPTSTLSPNPTIISSPPLSSTSHGSHVYTESSPVTPMLNGGVFTDVPAVLPTSSKKKMRPKSMGPSSRPFTLLTA